MWVIATLILVGIILVIYMFAPKKEEKQVVIFPKQANLNEPQSTTNPSIKKTSSDFPMIPAIEYGWNTWKANIGFFIIILIISGLIQGVYNISFKVASERTIAVEDLSLLGVDSYKLFQELAEKGYINRRGVIQERFKRTYGASKMDLDELYENKKYDIYNAIRRVSSSLPSSKIPFYFIGILLWVLVIVVGMGMIKIPLKIYDNEKPEISDLFNCFPLFLKYIGGAILYGLIMFGGFILLIVPGIIWGIKFQFFTYFIIDKGQGPIEALKSSAAITEGSKLNLFAFGFLLGAINLAGILALCIGLFVSVPITMLALAFIYRKLLENLTPINITPKL